MTFSQKREKDTLPVPIDDIIFVNPGDTAVVKLNEFMLLPKRKFKSQKDIRYYFWLKFIRLQNWHPKDWMCSIPVSQK